MGPTLKVDQLAREFFNSCAIAAGMNDAQAALECCRNAFEIEQAYELRLKTADAAPRHALRKMPAKFPGRCAKCACGIAVGSAIAYDPDNKRAFHAECSP